MTKPFVNRMDLKGRLGIPVNMREVLGEEIVIVRHLRSGGLALYPIEMWLEVCQGIKEIPEGVRKRTMQELFVDSAVTVSLDRQGRINLPVKFRSWMGGDEGTDLYLELNNGGFGIVRLKDST